MQENTNSNLQNFNHNQISTIALMTLREVIDMVKLSKTTIYGLITKEMFPKPIKSGNASRWVYMEVEQWISTKMIERDSIH